MGNPVDVICVGNATIDVFVLLKNLKDFSYDKFSNNISFPLGSKIPLDEHKLELGGNACNVSVGLKRLGITSSLAAEIGSDEFSDKIIKQLYREGVDLSFLERNDRQVPYFNIVLAYGGDRTILEEKNSTELKVEIGEINPKFFYLTSFNGEWKKVYEKVFSQNQDSLIAFNPGSRQLEEIDEIIALFPKIEILFLNMTEAQKITKENNPDIKVVLNKLKGLGVEIAAVTDGINGSYCMDKNGDIYQIGVLSSEKPTERTGAGDSYATGFLYGVINGYNVKESMKFGALNADSVIKKVGAQDGLLKLEEMEQLASSKLEINAIKI